METLILKTEGMSAYGVQTFDVQRRVNNFPTRSAIIGLLGAALGIRRSEHEELYSLSTKLVIAVQVNNIGQKIMDYHTVQNFRSPAGKIKKSTKQTYREYWCDSEHTFAITSGKDMIDRLENAVKKPIFTLFQGRKSCPMTRPLFDSRKSQDNPVKALLDNADGGQIFSDVPGPHQIATLKIRDVTGDLARKYSMRSIYLCSKET
ncbi:MAG: type I-E CRISPR-associated protein Cas5/CasD [Cycloclasticus sp.]|nr:MAG: type I-E CRISPR-associated protein Cas5/CasD [Cycloclasticus sp.]